MTAHRIRIVRSRWVVGLSALTILGVLAWQFHRLPAGTWEHWIESVPKGTLLVALAILPIFGFPVSALHLAAGARFGILPGALAVAVTTFVHLGGGFLLARTLGRPVRHLLAACGWNLPRVKPTAVGTFTLWMAVLPGISYGLKNLIPPLAGVRWRVYILISLPVHVATSFIGLAIGHATIQFSWGIVAFAALYTAVLAVLTRHLVRRLRASSAPDELKITPDPDRTPPEGGRKSRGPVRRAEPARPGR